MTTRKGPPTPKYKKGDRVIKKNTNQFAGEEGLSIIGKGAWKGVIVEDPEEYLGYSRPYWEADDVKLINRHLEAAIRSGRLDPSYRNRVKFKQRGDEGLCASKLGEPCNFGRSGINKFIGDDVHARTGELIPKDRTATQRGAKDYVTTWLDTVDYSV